MEKDRKKSMQASFETKAFSRTGCYSERADLAAVGRLLVQFLPKRNGCRAEFPSILSPLLLAESLSPPVTFLILNQL